MSHVTFKTMVVDGLFCMSTEVSMHNGEVKQGNLF